MKEISFYLPHNDIISIMRYRIFTLIEEKILIHKYFSLYRMSLLQLNFLELNFKMNVIS